MYRDCLQKITSLCFAISPDLTVRIAVTNGPHLNTESIMTVDYEYYFETSKTEKLVLGSFIYYLDFTITVYRFEIALSIETKLDLYRHQYLI